MIMVTGASGRFSSAVLAELCARGIPVVGGSRTPSVGQRHVDFSVPDGLDFNGVDTLLLVSAGAQEDDHQIAFNRAAVEVAERDGVSHLVYTSLTGAGDHLSMALPHRVTERIIMTSGMTWTILRNGVYSEILGALLSWEKKGTGETLRIVSPLGDGAVAVVARIGARAGEYQSLVMAGRSHNVAAQATTLGKRFASAADEMLVAIERVEELLRRYPLRGIKGPMGTAQDMLDLMGGDENKLASLETRVADHLGFRRVFDSVGQVYPRSLDFDVVSALVELGAGPSSLATTIRLMAGNEVVTEGFKEGQVGSSAMPHKMNARSCERVGGMQILLRGYLTMVADLAGQQWNEGDVFCSVVRRVALPDAFFTIDGMCETFLTVLDEFGAFPAMIERELERYLPFLATTRILMAAVRAGVGRETAHEAIKENAVAVALNMRENGAEQDLIQRLADDDRIPLTLEQLQDALADRSVFIGAAESQVARVLARVNDVVSRHPEAATYKPGEIL